MNLANYAGSTGSVMMPYNKFKRGLVDKIEGS